MKSCEILSLSGSFTPDGATPENQNQERAATGAARCPSGPGRVQNARAVKEMGAKVSLRASATHFFAVRPLTGRYVAVAPATWVFRLKPKSQKLERTAPAKVTSRAGRFASDQP